ncbi:MAG: hypothetical protein QNJ51_26380 [Calothrix sp. MO_167.B12]|nr:hypothetical protein [Calothrix sp. MO_167.B12]
MSSLAVATVISNSEALVEQQILSFETFLKLRDQEGKVFEAASEIYTRLSNYSVLDQGASEKSHVPTGSSWILECLPDQQYHWHSFSTEDRMLSARRVFFIADRGLRISVFENPASFLQPRHEIFECEGPVFLEFEFCGSHVHRFRPLSGRLFALSIHHKDESVSNTTLGQQTHIFSGESPQITQRFHLTL